LKQVLLVFLFTIISYASLTIHPNETFTLNEDETLVINDDLIIQENASFVANTNTKINIFNNWQNLGTFSASTSSVEFLNTNESYIKGNNTFYNFKATKDLLFQSATTQKFLNELTLKGDAKSSFIHSDTIGTQAIFDLSNHPSINVSYLEVQDMKNIGILRPLMPSKSVNLKNTVLWFDENIPMENNCSTQDDNITSFTTLQCNNTDEKQYISTQTSKVKSTFIIPEVLTTNTIKTIIPEVSSFIYDDDPLTQCNLNAIVKLINDGSTSTGFINETSCEKYEDPTIQNFESIKDETKVYLVPTTILQKEKYTGSKSVIILDINLSNPIIIGDK
jgi:hypothetical protein